MAIKIKTKTWTLARKSARRVLPAAALAVLGLAGASSNNVFAETDIQTWGPERNTFTWESPATYRTFNSITDNPEVGDERNFVRVRKNNDTDQFSDNVTAEPGQQYEVYVYFHNNASTNLNATGEGIANNVRLSMAFPEVISDGQAAMIKGTISSTNTNPGSVWDTAYIHASENQTVYLRYVPNSAKIYSQGTINGEILSDTALYSEEGAKLGYYKNYWGMLPGCSEYAGYVKFLIQVDQPGFYMEKTAAKEGTGNYDQYITVSPGDTIDFKIRYHNVGTTIQNDVTAFDNLPEGMNMISGSTFLETPSTKGFESDALFDGGLIIGDYRPDEQAIITYQAKIADDKDLFPCGDTKIYNNSAVATANGTIHDKVEVTVHRTCEEEPEEEPEANGEVDMPDELPKTGPGEIVLGIVVITMIGVGTTYYVASRKQLRKLQAPTDEK